MRLVRIALVLLLTAAPLGAAAEVVLAQADDLFEWSLEDLRNFKITSASKKPEALSRTAAAIHVLTHEELLRSGYTNVAEALRMVPGLQVARTRSSSWAIGARGFNTGLSNKLLVLVDGRSVYSPLFSGVFWELHDVPIEEIDRIEVIRGPGGTLWGANAVNGVINIITRKAGESPGPTFSVAAGSEERARGYMAWSGAVAGRGDLRVSGSYTDRDDGFEADDDWRMGRVQFRFDADAPPGDSLSVTGRVYRGAIAQEGNVPILDPPYGQAVAEDGDRRGAHLQAQWSHALAADSEISAQAYYEYSDLDFVSLRERRHTADLDVQHRFQPFASHELVWGGAVRLSWDDVQDSMTSLLEPDRRSVWLASAFFRDEISLLDDELRLAFGTKIEHNAFTSWEFQPRVQLSWNPAPRHSFWASATRAVRTPSRLEDDANVALLTQPPGFIHPTLPTLLVAQGRDTMAAEKLLAFEAGYRFGLPDFSLDVAAFANRYRDLVTAEPGALRTETEPTDHAVLPYVLGNDLGGRTWGIEVSGRWQVRPDWRLEAWYSHLRMHLDTREGSGDVFSEAQEDRSPHHQVFLRSAHDLSERWRVDLLLRGVSRLPEGLPGYLDADLRLAFAPRPGLELSLVGQNLFHGHRREATGATFSGVERGVYGLVRWGF